MGASEIIPRLWQGSRPPFGPIHAADGISLIVLMAKEFQPPATMFPGVQVVHAPIDDAPRPPSRTEQAAIRRAAARTLEVLHRGSGIVALTCNEGRNRSGAVTLLVLRSLGYSADDALALIRSKRPYALTNPFLVEYATTTLIIIGATATDVAPQAARSRLRGAGDV